MGQGQVNGAGGRGDVERDAVFFGEDGQGVGANLVGSVAVGGNAVGAGDDAGNLALPHQDAGGGIGHQRGRNAQLLELPGGEAGALQPGAGFGVIDGEPAAGFPAGADDAQSGAVSGCGQRAGVAVGEDAPAVGGQQGAPVFADAAVDSLVLLLNPAGFGFQAGVDAAGVGFGLGHAEHPAHGPAQVDGGRAGGGDVGAGLPQSADEVVALPGLQLGGGQYHRVGGGNADGRGAADAHLGNGGGGGAVVGNADDAALVGQQRLVEQLQAAAGPVDGANFGHNGNLSVGLSIWPDTAAGVRRAK